MIHYIVFYQVYFVKGKEVQEHTEEMATSSGTFEEEYHNGTRYISYIRLCIYDVHTKGGVKEGGLDIATCLQILLFLNNIFGHCCRWRVAGPQKWSVFVDIINVLPLYSKPVKNNQRLGKFIKLLKSFLFYFKIVMRINNDYGWNT